MIAEQRRFDLSLGLRDRDPNEERHLVRAAA